MKHLFTLSERLRAKWERFATFATFAMQSLKATKRQSDTTIFAKSLKSLKSLMSIFAESANSAKSAMSFFASRGVKDVRVSLGQYPTNIQLISNLSLTINKHFTRFAAVFALVFVLGVGNVWGETVTYTITSKTAVSTSGTAPTNSSASYSQTYSTAGQATKDNTMTLTLTGFDGCTITGVSISAKNNKSSGNGSGSLTINGTNKGSVTGLSGMGNSSWTTKTFTVTSTKVNNSGSVVVTLSCSANSLYCQSFTITYTAPASCDKKVTITAGTPESGASFSLNKTGEQDCCSALTVTVSSITAPSGKQFSAITQSGINSGVTIDQENKTVTYAANSTGSSTINVTFVDLPKYTVTLKDDNATRTQASYGAAVTLPERAGCTGYTFAGWTKTWTSAQSSWTTTAPTIIPAGSYTPTGDENLYPVYTKEEEGGTEEHETIFDWTPSNSPLSSEQDGITATFAKGNGGNSPQYNSTGTAIRLYYKNTLTFVAEDGITLKTIVFTTASSNGTFLSTVSVTSGFFSTKTWSGINASSGTLTNSTTASSGHTRVQKATVTYETSGGTTTYYISEPNCCTPLGQIKGTINLTNVSPTSVTVGVPSTYEDIENENLTGFIFKRYAAASGGNAIESIETNEASGTSVTFSSELATNTAYYYTITAKHESSSCNSPESDRQSYTIASYTVSYANGGGSGTNPGAHDPVLANGTVDLKSNTFDAPTGKEFKAWNDGTKDYDGGETYTVTANTTMTAQWQCLEPGFTKNLSTAQVNYLQGQKATALSITAAANGAELSYAWEMSANGTTGWSSVGINSNEYTPSTTTEGDQYYHCIVTNLVDGCTDSKATSSVAHIHVDVPAACLQPIISVASGPYYEDKSVTITCGTEGAAIYYTTDGGAPGSGSTLYTGAITVDHSMTIKAIAIKAEMDNSTVAEATYTIKCVTPTIGLAAGNYTGVQTTTITKGYGTKIYYTTDGSTPSNTNGTEYTEAVSIDQPMTLKAIVWKDGCTNSEVASAAYTLKCETPTFNNGTGTYTDAQSITLSCATTGADIYYTLNGSTPSKENGTKYTAAIEVSANQTVKAIAVKEGWGDSEIASATYTIQYNVYWWVNGVPWTGKGGSTLVTYGQTATAPTTAPTKADGCGDKFMGWTETQNYENDNTAPMDMFTETSAAITGETNFYAVFADYGEEE